MNYTLENLPDSGQNPIIYFDIEVAGKQLGRIYIKLYRDVFPAGVENFVQIAAGSTYKTQLKGCGKSKFVKQIQRSYADSIFYHKAYNRYMVSGDIYTNNGDNAGTIFNDKPIPADFGPEYITHDKRGIVSLVPFQGNDSDELFYDSTFMITLADNMQELDEEQIAIGYVCEGLDILEQVNETMVPFAGRSYPEAKISRSGIHQSTRPHRRPRAIVESLCVQKPRKRKPGCPNSHPRCQSIRK